MPASRRQRDRGPPRKGVHTLGRHTSRRPRATGHGPALDAVQDALDRRDWGAVGHGLSEGLVAEIGLAGTPAACREAKRSFEEAGLDLLVLMPIPMPNKSETQHHAEVIEALGQGG